MIPIRKDELPVARTIVYYKCKVHNVILIVKKYHQEVFKCDDSLFIMEEITVIDGKVFKT